MAAPQQRSTPPSAESAAAPPRRLSYARIVVPGLLLLGIVALGTWALPPPQLDLHQERSALVAEEQAHGARSGPFDASALERLEAGLALLIGWTRTLITLVAAGLGAIIDAVAAVMRWVTQLAAARAGSSP